MSQRAFLLGEWSIEPSRNRVTRGSTTRRITPKAMEVLLALAARGGEAASREELLSSVWPDVHVQEEVLTRAIADLRKALEDDSKEPRYIETIPKRGYRLVVEVGSAVQERRSMTLWGGALALAAIASVVAFRYRDIPTSGPLVLESRPLTTLPGREIEPELSPDGERVAFAWEGRDASNWDVYVKLVSAETVSRLTQDPAADLAPAWSPDGGRLAFARYSEMNDCRIFSIDALGGREREIGSCGKSQNPDLAWSPDGLWLAFSDRESDTESFGIFLLSVETGERRKLIAPDGQHWGDKDPAFSPDGKWISFTRSLSMSDQDVYRVRVEGGEPERVTFDGREVRGHAFAPEGDALVVSSARTGQLGLWRFPLSGGSPTPWVFPGGMARAPEIGAAGELLFEERWRDFDIASLSLDGEGKEAEPLVVSTREDRDPALSPDGSRIAFVSSRSGSPEIWVSELSGGQPVRLTDFRGPQVSAPAWSSDGKRLLFEARPDGHADLFLVAIGNGKPRPIASSPKDEIAGSFSPDGKLVFFGSDRSGRWEIWKAGLDSGAAEPVTRKGGYAGRASPDGRFVYFTRFESPGLHRLDLESNEEAPVEKTEILIDAVSWAFIADSLLFIGFDAGRIQLFRLDSATGARRAVAPIDAEPGGGLAFDPRRDRVLFTRPVRNESDLVIALLPMRR